jgi:hypothetical protein
MERPDNWAVFSIYQMKRHDISEGLNLDTYSFTYEGIYGENEQEEKRVCEHMIDWLTG